MKMKKFFSIALAVTALVMGFASCKPGSKDADEVKLMFNELSLKVGETQQVKVVKATGDVTWTTASEAIATVDAQGNITGVAEGQTVVTAKVGEASAVVNVTVTGSGAGSAIPEIAKPEEGYVTIAIEIPAGSECHGIAFKGTVDGAAWSGADTYLKADGTGNGSPEECAKFEPIEGFENWYKLTLKLGEVPFFEDVLLAGKICLIFSGDGSWQGQASKWAVNEEETSAQWNLSDDGNLQVKGSGVVFVKVDEWQKSECAEVVLLDAEMVFVPAADDVIPDGTMIFTGNFTEKDWGNSDREMVKGEDGKYTWKGQVEPGMKFKVFVVTADSTQVWALNSPDTEDGNLVLPENVTFPYEFTMRFTEAPAE